MVTERKVVLICANQFCEGKNEKHKGIKNMDSK